MTITHRVLTHRTPALLAGLVGLAALAAVAALASLLVAPATRLGPETAHLAPLSLSTPTAGVPDLGGAGRPANGAVLRSTDRHGDGEVIVDGGTRDAVLTLARHGRAVRSVYVRAGEKPMMVDVPDGTYDVYVTTGTGWSRATHRFAHPARARHWSEPIRFTTTAEQYTWWELTVDDVPDGTIETTDVAATSVPV